MKSWFKDNRSFILFMCCFGVFRLAVADWNPIRSCLFAACAPGGDGTG